MLRRTPPDAENGPAPTKVPGSCRPVIFLEEGADTDGISPFALIHTVLLSLTPDPSIVEITEQRAIAFHDRHFLPGEESGIVFTAVNC